MGYRIREDKSGEWVFMGGWYRAGGFMARRCWQWGRFSLPSPIKGEGISRRETGYFHSNDMWGRGAGFRITMALLWLRKGMKMGMGFTPSLTFPHQGGRDFQA